MVDAYLSMHAMEAMAWEWISFHTYMHNVNAVGMTLSART